MKADKETLISVYVCQDGKEHKKEYRVQGNISGKLLQDMFDDCVDAVLDSLTKDGILKEEEK
jgi:hypothetical protein